MQKVISILNLINIKIPVANVEGAYFCFVKVMDEDLEKRIYLHTKI